MAEESAGTKKRKQGTVIASEQEVDEAIKKLTSDEVLCEKLVRLGRFIARQLLGDVERDLFHESLVKVAEQEHHWYKDTHAEFFNHIVARMKTIAQSQRKKGDRRVIYDEARVLSAVSIGVADITCLRPTDFETKADYLDSRTVDIERVYLEKIRVDKTCKKLRLELTGNKNAREVFELILLGCEANEIRRALQLSDSSYNSAITYIYRKRLKLGLA